MITDKIDEKRSRFTTLLRQLAESQTMLSSKKEKQNVYKELELLYYTKEGEEEFRHFYSDIFAVLSQIDMDTSLGNLEILNQNMDIIRQDYQSVNKDESGKTINIGKQINKLYDHINLDIARINYSKTIEMRSQGELQKINASLSSMKENVETVQGNIDKASDLQKQYITILGIFASIVLAFTGGIAFSTSVLENIAAASIYRIALIVIGLAFILINIIYILTRFVQEINKKDGEKIEYPGFMKILNGIFIGAVLLTIIGWLFGAGKAAELFQNWLY